uniref:MiT/TFE transcription factors N-terminal domain-containing protein n=1 Tax=Anopheles melas TaxID=34690 RepID=A0A182TUH3_9DIPT
MDNFERILVDVDCSRYEEDAFSLLDKSRDVNIVRDLRSSTVSAFDHFPQLNISSRTQLKQQLFREQIKNSETGPRSMVTSPGPPVLSVRLPLENIDIELPKKVLQVETRLENPTRYHVIQKQKTQVREYVTAALKLTKQNLVRESCRHTRLMILGRLYDSFISAKPASAGSGGAGPPAAPVPGVGGGVTPANGVPLGPTAAPNGPGKAVSSMVVGGAPAAIAGSAQSSGTPSATPTIEQQQEWRLEMKLSCRFGNKLYQTFVDEFDYVRDLLGLIRFEIPKWVFVVSEFEDEISSYECNRAARAAQQAAVAAVAADQEFLVRPGLAGEKGSKHEKFIEPEVRDRIKKDNHNCSRYLRHATALSNRQEALYGGFAGLLAYLCHAVSRHVPLPFEANVMIETVVQVFRLPAKSSSRACSYCVCNSVFLCLNNSYQTLSPNDCSGRQKISFPGKRCASFCFPFIFPISLEVAEGGRSSLQRVVNHLPAPVHVFLQNQLA